MTASYGANLLILFGLGITWILDGIEITIVGAIAPVLRDQETLGLSAAQIGSSASAYVESAVVGALIFGWQPDRFGRRLVFLHRFDLANHDQVCRCWTGKDNCGRVLSPRYQGTRKLNNEFWGARWLGGRPL